MRAGDGLNSKLMMGVSQPQTGYIACLKGSKQALEPLHTPTQRCYAALDIPDSTYCYYYYHCFTITLLTSTVKIS